MRYVVLLVVLGCSEVIAPNDIKEPCTVGYTICGPDPLWALRCNDGRIAQAKDWAVLRPFNLSEVTAGGAVCQRQ